MQPVLDNKPTNREQGAVALLVAMSLMLLAGFAALAVDGGMAYNERRTTQNAADNAALAGAWALCHGEDAVQAAVDSAQLNGYTPPQMEAPQVDGDSVTVRIQSEVATGFGRTQGVTEMDVASLATATCTEGGGLGDVAILAKGNSCAFNKSGTGTVDGLTYSANDIVLSGKKTFNGPVHADGQITSSGSSITYNDTVSSVEGYIYSGHPTFNGGPPITVPEPWDLEYPIDYEVDDYDLDKNGAKALEADALGQYYPHEGGWTLSGSETIQPGLHFVYGNVTVSGSNKSFDSVTIVATGLITFSGKHQFTPYVDGLSLMSGFNGGCGAGISISGNSDFHGIVFAPNGAVTISGTTVDGSVFGLAFSDSGNMDITANTEYLPGGDPEAKLVR